MPAKSYRVYVGLVQDSRLAAVALETGLSRAALLGLWMILLDTALQAPVAGSLSGWDEMQGAALSGLSPQDVRAVWQALERRGMIDRQKRLVDWPRYQTAQARRTAVWRARQKSQTRTMAVKPAQNKRERQVVAEDDAQAVAARRARLLQQGRTVKNPEPSHPK